MQVIGFKEIPIPIVKKILEEELKKQEALGITLDLSSLAYRTKEYVDEVSKCDSEKAERAYNRLLEKGLREITAAILVNILPKTVDEARILLNFEPRTLTTEEIEEILRILEEECST